MITKEITLCRKQVTLAYCFATEISYKILSDEDITDFIAEAATAIQDKDRMPDIRKTIFLVLASMQSYYESKDEQAPITDKQLMYDSTPKELCTALGVVIGLRTNFHHIPKDEPEDKPNEGSKEKNA